MPCATAFSSLGEPEEDYGNVKVWTKPSRAGSYRTTLLRFENDGLVYAEISQIWPKE